MSLKRHWCWELQPSKHGPDWLCIVEITPATIPYLQDFVPALSLLHYTYIPAPKRYCDTHQKICSHHYFMDKYHAEAFKEILQGTNQHNLWIFNMIEIHEGQITIESGYAGEDHVYRELETNFLIDLCDNPHIAIASWTICAGGMGYDYITVHTGKTSAELKQYITG